MIHINNIHAINIPIITKKLRKTKIYCFSTSSLLYFYKKCKSKEKTTNPCWDIELDIELFRCHTLSFILYSSKSCHKKNYIGRCDIDITSFLIQNNGKTLIENPKKTNQFEFEIKACIQTETFLRLSISYCPTIYPSMKLSDISCSFIHIWASYSPPNYVNYDAKKCPIEICMIQGNLIKKKDCCVGNYSYYNKTTLWEPVGYSSQNNHIYNQTGLSQIHSIFLHRIKYKFEIFVINVFNYKGTVALNFVIENNKKVKIINHQQYNVPNIKNKKIGTINTYHIQCEPYHKYCFPFCLSYGNDSIKFTNFPCLSMKHDSSFSTVSDTIFNKEILSNVSTIFSEYHDKDFLQTNQINDEKISLLKYCTDNKITTNVVLRIFVGGGNNYDPFDDDTCDYWKPYFLIYDKSTHERIKKAEKSLINHEFYEQLTNIENRTKVFGFDWNFCVRLSLNHLDINHVIIFLLHWEYEMEYTDADGFFLITQEFDDHLTLLFRNMVYPDKDNTHYIMCFRLEFIEDSWVICPMRSYYTDKKKLLSSTQYLISNNWVFQDDNFSEQNKSNGCDISEKELSIGDDS